MVDTAHGHREDVLEAVALLSKQPSCFDIVGGNIATRVGAQALTDSTRLDPMSKPPALTGEKNWSGPWSLVTLRFVLVEPTSDLRPSFLAAMREWEKETGTADADRLSVADLSVPGCFEEYVRLLRNSSHPWQRAHSGSRVRCWWWVDTGREFVGRISIWPDLRPGVCDANHIGYAVRPSRRREGHATGMLAAALPIAHGMGVDPVVLVCAETNIGSRAVIERNGGILTAVNEGRCRYLIDRLRR